MGNKIRGFFLFCSGASEELLSQTKCAHEYNKHVGIGVSVFLTALLAFLTGSYIFFSIFNSTLLALFSGFIWGTIIFNLDRFMVSTLRKKKANQNLSFGKRLRQNSHVLISVAPRLLMGVIISIVIVTPLQLKLFEKEIDLQIAQRNVEAVRIIVSDIRHDFSRIDDLEHQNYELNERIDTGRDKVNTYLKAADDELAGFAGTGISGAGPVYKEKQEAVYRSKDEFRELISDTKPVIAQNEHLIASLTAKRDALIDEARLSIQQANGLLSRLTALQELSGSNPALKWTYYIILVLFILVEISPLLVKLLSPRGPYDDLLDHLEGGIQGGGAVAERLVIIEEQESVIIEEQESSRSLQLGVFILELMLPAKVKDNIVGDLLESYSNRPSKAWASFWVYKEVLTSVGALLLQACRDAILRRINRP